LTNPVEELETMRVLALSGSLRYNAGPGRGGRRRALGELRRVLGIIGADVIASSLAVSSIHHRFINGSPDAELRIQLGDVVAALTSHASVAGAALAG
jgi:hypothetical protein